MTYERSVLRIDLGCGSHKKEGTLGLAVAVYDDSLSHPYDHHDWMYRFIVVDREDKPGFGLLPLACEWRQRVIR